MKAPFTPVIIGAAQCTQSPTEKNPLHPLALIARSAGEVLSQSRLPTPGEVIDTVYVVNIFSWPYANAPRELAQILGLKPKETFYSPLGGNMPQTLVNQAARKIAAGECRAVLLAGGETAFSARRLAKKEIAPDWPEPQIPEQIGLDGDTRPLTSDIELSYGLFLPIHVYGFFETALRAAAGRNVDAHQMVMGRLFSRLSQVAAANPHAWHRTAYTPEEIAGPGPGNPMLCYPYTKRMIANMNVDQAASLIITSDELADRMGVPPELRVYPRGGADLENIRHFSRRPALHDSPALKKALDSALDQADLNLQDIQLFDIYSCFPSMVQITLQAMNLSPDDPRVPTLTGGLPFFGGPFNNYSMHAIVEAVDRIRRDRDQKALITANGGFNTKHSVGIYGDAPSPHPWGQQDMTALQSEITAAVLPSLREKARGKLRVEAYVVRHDLNGRPEQGTVLGRLEDDGRALAHIRAEAEDLAEMEKTELVGRIGMTDFDETTGCNHLRF